MNQRVLDRHNGKAFLKRVGVSDDKELLAVNLSFAAVVHDIACPELKERAQCRPQRQASRSRHQETEPFDYRISK